MALVSVREAARLLSVDERTVRRWVANKRLASQQGVNGRLVIDEGEIERVRLELQSGPPAQQTLDLGLLIAEVKLMQSEMETLRQRVEYLEAMAQPREKKQVAPPAPRTAPDVTLTSKRPLPEMSDLAGDLEIATVFAQRHFPATPVDRIPRLVQILRENGSVAMTEGHYKHGRATAKYALDQAGRHAFYEATHGRDGFEECPDCPH